MNLITIISPQPSFKLLEPNNVKHDIKAFFFMRFFFGCFFFFGFLFLFGRA